MKRIILSAITFAALTFNIWAQSPEAFKYQSVVRDASQNVIPNQAVGMQLTILQGSASGSVVYQETFAPTTNAYGLVNIEIGTGTVVSGTFSTIDWANGPYFIETALDATGGTSYSVMGTSQLLSVPYALYAKTSGSSIPGPQGPAGTNGIDGINGVDGAVGPQGPIGLTGPAGTNGFDGINGVDGAVGPMGPQGPIGLTGPAGTNGFDGINGVDGAVGPMGPQGPIGLTGATGATGPTGLTGATGAAGSANISGTTNNIIKFTSATTGGNSQLFDDGTNVGIGTTTPLGALDVFNGSGSANNWIYFRRNSVGNPSTSFNSGLAFGWNKSGGQGETEIVFSNGAGALPRLNISEWNAATSTYITHVTVARSSGNVGIGTQVPSAKLEVVGQVKITGGAPAVGKVLTSDANGLATWATPAGPQKIYFSAGNNNNNTALPDWSFNKSNSLLDTKVGNPNIIVVQQTGLYVISCSATLSSTNFLLNLLVNNVQKFGSSPSSGYTAGSATWGSVSRTWSILLNAGDELEITTGVGSIWDGAGDRDILTIYKID